MAPSDSDVTIIIAKTTAEIADPRIEGTIRGYCVECQVEVWVAPNSQRRIKEFDAKVYCVACGLMLVRDKEHMIMGTQGSMEEIKKDASLLGIKIHTLRNPIEGNPDDFLRKRREMKADEQHPKVDSGQDGVEPGTPPGAQPPDQDRQGPDL
jgi:hypothetical protein